MDYRQMTAPCGLDCFHCPVYLAAGNEKIKKAVAERLNIPLERVACRGCRNERGTIEFLNMTEPCNVYKCIDNKGISFCSDCPDFPCDHLHPYADLASQRPHNIKVFNLSLIKKMGLDKWAAEKAKSVRETYFKGRLKLSG